MLASYNPAILNRGVKVVGKNEALMPALRAAGDHLAATLARITGRQLQQPTEEALGVGRQ